MLDTNLNGDIFVETFRRVEQVLAMEELSSFGLEVSFDADKYEVIFEISIISTCDGLPVQDEVYEQIANSGFNSEYFLPIIERIINYLESTDNVMFRLPILMGVRYNGIGAIPVLDLRVELKGAEDASI